jgi:Cu(I)/Ag(I) efflux system membrane fusion protein
MLVDVELPIKLPPGLSIPADAVVDSGLRKRVYVDRGGGSFEPREIETGWREGDRVQILKGLVAGERIAASGTFLLDSESRLKADSTVANSASVKDPVCGMDTDQDKANAAGRKSEHAGVTYYFCSETCKRKFVQTQVSTCLLSDYPIRPMMIT